MSAIYGVINKKGQPVDRTQLNNLREAIKHRAFSGYEEHIEANIAFGICKLDAYPSQQNANLPFIQGDLVFNANARLHNRPELVNLLGLSSNGKESSDAALILDAYIKWGKKCVDHLDGEYVFAVWNNATQELFIASDHIGFKPLFYFDSADQFIFCSQLTGVEAAKPTPHVFDDTAIFEFFFKQGDPASTYNKDIKALCGGNYLELKNGNLSKTKYWHFQPLGKYRFTKDQDWYDCMREKMWKAVEDRVDTMATIGITLSGGLDSSSVTSILCQVLKKQNRSLHAFSSALPGGYKGPHVDEREYIQSLSDKYDNIIQHFVTAEGGNPFANVPEALESDDIFPNYFHYMDKALCVAAKEKGVDIFYSGFGGDFWSSSNGMRVVYEMLNRGQLFKTWSILRQIQKTEKTSFYRIFKREYVGHMPSVKWLVERKNWTPSEIFQPAFIRRFSFTGPANPLKSMTRLIDRGKISRLASMFDSRNETYGMASATPLFDRNLMEFLADVPLEYFVKNGYRRSLIRYAMEGILPEKIQWRITKNAYVPDHWEKYSNEQATINHVISSISRDAVLQKFFNSAGCNDLAREINPANIERFPLRRQMAFRIYLIVISGLALNYLEKKEYNFVDY